jgi:hypothetical protein
MTQREQKETNSTDRKENPFQCLTDITDSDRHLMIHREQKETNSTDREGESVPTFA